MTLYANIMHLISHSGKEKYSRVMDAINSKILMEVLKPSDLVLVSGSAFATIVF